MLWAPLQWGDTRTGYGRRPKEIACAGNLLEQALCFLPRGGGPGLLRAHLSHLARTTPPSGRERVLRADERGKGDLPHPHSLHPPFQTGCP